MLHEVAAGNLFFYRYFLLLLVLAFEADISFTILLFDLLNLGQSHFFFVRKQLLSEMSIIPAKNVVKSLLIFIVTKIDL